MAREKPLIVRLTVPSRPNSNGAPWSACTPKSPAAKQVYQELRQMILEFELYPGSRVTETELAEIFNVSRTLIRCGR